MRGTVRWVMLVTRYGLLLVCAALGGASGAIAGALEETRTLVEQGHYGEAYAAGAQHPELLGTAEFDYFFGIAAAESGHAGEAVLSFERFVFHYPENLPARAELARAYFLAGEDERAGEEFRIVLKGGPEAAVRRTVERYLDLIAARQSRYQATTAFYVEAGYGWDSNGNGGVDDAHIDLPGIGPTTVLPNGVRKSDTFLALAAGGQYTRPLTPEWKMFGGLNIDDKSNRSHHENNLLDTTLAAGAERTLGADTQRITLMHDVVAVGGSAFRSGNAIGSEWQHRLGEYQAFSASGNVVRYAYAGDNAPRDATLTALCVGYRRILRQAWQPLLQLGASYSREANRKNRDDLGRDIAGVRLAVDAAPAAAWLLGVGLSYQDSRYGNDVLLATKRHDRYRSIDATVRYGFSRSLSLRGELLLSDNRSNLELNRYKRNVAAVKLRYEFK